jgi:hypothetical protein
LSRRLDATCHLATVLRLKVAHLRRLIAAIWWRLAWGPYQWLLGWRGIGSIGGLEPPDIPLEPVSEPTKALVADPFVLVVGCPALPLDVTVFWGITRNQEGRRAECTVVMVPVGLPQEVGPTVKSCAGKIGAALFEIKVGQPFGASQFRVPAFSSDHKTQAVCLGVSAIRHWEPVTTRSR